MKPARTRFAPSPTGFMHVGGIRTALFAWLIARGTDGKFILRLEDTDQAREVSGSDMHIMDSLRDLGLNYDEGPDIGGPFGPYRQSERLDIYHEWANKLIEKGRAYADPYSPAELQEFRESAIASKKPFLFRDHRPVNPPKWELGRPLRFLSDPKDYTWNDAVLGELSTGAEAIDDFIILKSDGFPTYNFAHIVDDLLMEITHVIRSQEFLASVPRYLNLYEALDIQHPILATVPFVMGPDGRKKLSKRDGAKDVLEYLREGYLEEALLNFIATLGWNDGTEQEIFSTKELIEKFSLDHVQRSGARFDEQRLLWMNGAHIRELSLDELYQRAADFWPEEASTYDDTYKKAVLGLVQERLKYLGEIPALTRLFFVDLPVDQDLITSHKQLSKLAPGELKELLQVAYDNLSASDFTLADLQQRLNQLLSETQQKPAVLFSLIRIASTQAQSSPSLAESLAVIGKERSLARIDTSLKSIS